MEEQIIGDTEKIAKVGRFKHLGSVTQIDATANLELQREITDWERIIRILHFIL